MRFLAFGSSQWALIITSALCAQTVMATNYKWASDVRPLYCTRRRSGQICSNGRNMAEQCSSKTNSRSKN